MRRRRSRGAAAGCSDLGQERFGCYSGYGTGTGTSLPVSWSCTEGFGPRDPAARRAHPRCQAARLPSLLLSPKSTAAQLSFVRTHEAARSTGHGDLPHSAWQRRLFQGTPPTCCWLRKGTVPRAALLRQPALLTPTKGTRSSSWSRSEAGELQELCFFVHKAIWESRRLTKGTECFIGAVLLFIGICVTAAAPTRVVSRAHLHPSECSSGGNRRESTTPGGSGSPNPPALDAQCPQPAARAHARAVCCSQGSAWVPASPGPWHSPPWPGTSPPAKAPC